MLIADLKSESTVINAHESDELNCNLIDVYNSKKERLKKKVESKKVAAKHNENQKNEDRKTHQVHVNSILDNHGRFLKLDCFNKEKFRNLVDLQKKNSEFRCCSVR